MEKYLFINGSVSPWLFRRWRIRMFDTQELAKEKFESQHDYYVNSYKNLRGARKMDYYDEEDGHYSIVYGIYREVGWIVECDVHVDDLDTAEYLSSDEGELYFTILTNLDFDVIKVQPFYELDEAKEQLMKYRNGIRIMHGEGAIKEYDSIQYVNKDEELLIRCDSEDVTYYARICKCSETQFCEWL